MRIKKACVGAAVSLLAVLLVASVSCGGGEAGGINAAKMLPLDTYYVLYADVQKLRNDSDLNKLYDYWRDYQYGDVEFEKGVTPSEVTHWVDADTWAGPVHICAGTFDLEEIRDELADKGYDRDEYRGVEVWEHYYNYSVAFIDGRLVLADRDALEDCVSVSQGNQSSFYGDSDVSQVINRLPSGLFVDVGKWADGYWVPYDGLAAMGNSVGKESESTLKIHIVMLFEDEDYAEDAFAEIEAQTKGEVEEGHAYYWTLGWRDVGVSRTGSFVEIRGSMDIEDFPFYD